MNAPRFSSTGPAPVPFDGERFRILALDGGGAKALFTAHLLAKLEDDLDTSIADHFDLIAGTSAGGIVALAEDSRKALHDRPGTADLPGRVDIRHSDIADLDIPAGSVDLICTDPPYLQSDFATGGPWDLLGSRAATWLKPGGLLLAYCAHIHLARAINVLAPFEADGLGYWWTYAVTFPNANSGTQVWSRAITPSWRPVLAYRKAAGPNVPRYTSDPVAGDGKEKDSAHPWQQGTQEAATFIQRLTTPGDLSVDPFVGSGTVAIAALSLPGRRVIGADTDADYVALAQRRTAAAYAPLTSEA